MSRTAVAKALSRMLRSTPGRLAGLAFAIAIVCAAAGPACAVVPAAATAAAAFDQRLATGASTTSDIALGIEVHGLLNVYLATDFPQGAPQAVSDAFLANLIQRFESMSDAEVDAFRQDFGRHASNPSALENRCTLLFNAVAFATIADDGTWQRPPDKQTSELQRLPGNAARRIDANPLTSAGWKAAEERFQAFAAARARANATPTLEFYGDPAAAASDPALREKLAAIPRSEWVAALERRLETLYGDQGIAVPPGFLHDLAQLQYVMVGWQIGVDGAPERVGTAALRRLNTRLRQKEGGLEQMLRAAQDAYGFRSQHPMPTGILPPALFALLLRAGYMLNDVGAPLLHGGLTHELQWEALMADYETHAADYTFTLIELFTGIGAYDAQAATTRAARFGFERPTGALWAQPFDLPYTNAILADFSHPDGVSALIESEPSLRDLSNALEERYRERYLAGQGLYRTWLANRNDPQGLAEHLPFVTQQLNASLQATYAALGNNPDAGRETLFAFVLGDRLYLANFYDVASAISDFQAATMPDGAGRRPVPVMTHEGRDLLDDSSDAEFQAELERQRDRRTELLAARQPQPSAPPLSDEDVAFDSSAAFQEDDAAKFADADLRAEADREQRARQRDSHDDDNESLSGQSDSESFDLAPPVSDDESFDLAPVVGDEDARAAAVERAIARSPDVVAEEPSRPLTLADAPPPPTEPPGERALRPGEAVPADNDREAQRRPDMREENEQKRVLADPEQAQ